jgi:hypothetical protein
VTDLKINLIDGQTVVSSFTPTGGDISVVWNASGLFSIA